MDKNKVALVTGASRGIGKSIAIGLAKEGYFVVVNYRGNEAMAQGTLEEIRKAGGQGALAQFNIGDFQEVQERMGEIQKTYGDILLLVNNAGITKDQLMLRMTEEDFDQVMEINLKGTFNCIKAVSKSMLKRRQGKIINITSVIGLVGNVGQANYAASKAGVIGLTKSLAREFAGRNITVNAVAPGFIKTDMTENLPESIREEILKKIPMSGLGEPEDVANAVVFLASDKANYITGQTIAVDGGMTM
ncbi:3-oxoacyl-[acyl-carrier-protein] reductase [Anaerotalea alkaliphila]|uniref:3-oxoacyl-[acyl-carrier-protein] reductase n=1 Tax=Anaerotalea alkaliphila TaxID=2662126 RepID=A0A7X5HWQ9_9FIRM|nr:3-oxoacyl-[acyl-carrier-protein] reductase [Anaerotalea alkaliphila]NDL68068.1 3-oxoacyl-[acyl-carrier-protein] reductase [Anaerotalea alkaliphila]